MGSASRLQLMHRGRAIFRIVAFAVTLGTAVPAAAQWSSIGAMPSPRRDGQSLIFRNPQGVVAVSVVAPGIIRVRFAPGQKLGRDHSYAVIASPKEDPAAKFEIGRDRSRIVAGQLTVSLQHSPFRVSFSDAGGNSLDEDDPERGIAFSGKRVRVWKRLRDDEHVYGFGEKNGRLNKRGRQLGGYSYAMWNSDTFALRRRHRSDLRVGAVLHRAAQAAARTASSSTTRSARNFDIGHAVARACSPSAPTAASSTTTSSTGPTPKQVIERYTELTGRMPLPPLWALGYHQCRYSYYPESQGPLHRRQLPRAPDPRRRDLARHPLPGRLQAVHVGPRSASPIPRG